MTLDMHLYITLQLEISLKLFIVVGASILRTKAILVELTHLGRVLVSKKHLTIAMKYLPIISQLLLNNKEVYPFGLGVFSSEMKNKVSLISSVVIHDSKKGIMSGGILL